MERGQNSAMTAQASFQTADCGQMESAQNFLNAVSGQLHAEPNPHSSQTISQFLDKNFTNDEHPHSSAS
jgi:hypothetical protein